MNKVQMLSGVACVSVFLATGALAELRGVESGTSDNPKDNVPQEIQRGSASGEASGTGGSGPGMRSGESGDMNKEKAEAATEQKLEENVEKTHGGGAAIAAEELNKKSMEKSNKDISDQRSDADMKKQSQVGSGQGGASGVVNSGPKKDSQKALLQNPDSSGQGQQ